MVERLRMTAVVGVIAAMAACGGSKSAEPPAKTEKIVPTDSGEMSPEEAGGMRPEPTAATAPASPHGGPVVSLGTVAKLELVLDPSSGMLTAYVLDADGKAVMRIPAKSLTLEVTPPGGKPTPLVLTSTANGFTGDTVGNSSQFGGTSTALKGVTAFTGSVKEAVVAGQTFRNVAFGYPVNLTQ